MAILYAVTLFVSAALLFLLQPMFALMLLPLLGGAPAVWNTAVVFYQFVLLVGYICAHLLHRWLPLRPQILLHAAMVLLPFWFLPITLPAGWRPPPESAPFLWVLRVLFVVVGIPFFVISTTSPLLQSWFARTERGTTRNPYVLYVASNVGSMVALLSYPFLIQPRTSLSLQSWLWTLGYGIFAALMLLVAILRWRDEPAVNTVTPHDDGTPLENRTIRDRDWSSASPLDSYRRVRWLLLAFAPSSLLLSVTTYITTRIAPIPLLWVIPLALYLLTFIWAFSQIPLPSWRRSGWVFAVLLSVAILALGSQILPRGKWEMPFHLIVFFCVALFCHGKLAEDRPHPQHLTEFYLWLSVGGVLGGVFSGLLAPLLFPSVIEYPLVLIGTAYFFQWQAVDPDPQERWRDWQIPLVLGGVVCLGIEINRWLGNEQDTLGVSLLLGFGGLVCFAFATRPLRFVLGLGVLFGAGVLVSQAQRLTIASERSFFGIVHVEEDIQHQYRDLVHGTTMHGRQSLDPALRREPLSYYSTRSPIGQLFSIFAENLRNQRIAIVGLGTGTLACYRTPEQRWTFFEIDPTIVRFARDPRYFTFLQDCAPQADIVIGDARLSLAATPAGQFALIVLDAYSSDAIPVHLLTREALAVYLAALTDHGLLALHISNIYFDLAPVVGNLVHDARLTAFMQFDAVDEEADQKQGKFASTWVVATRHAEDLHALKDDARWKELPATSALPVWTDNFASVLSAVRKNKIW